MSSAQGNPDGASSKEKRVVVLRYGLFGHLVHTQKEVGSVLGISRSYVSRIEKSALEKLRSFLMM